MPRNPHDFYETAPWQVDALVVNCPEIEKARTILCPCVGDGSLLRQLQRLLPSCQFYTNDLDPDRRADFHYDMTSPADWFKLLQTMPRPDWIIENPPFACALPILDHAVQVAGMGVAIMARVSFCEPTKERGPWLTDHPYQKRITLERYSFTGNHKTDSATTDWLIWSKIPLAGPFGVVAAGFRP